MSENYTTYWVRSHFTLTEEELNADFVLYFAHDDICKAYVNGVLVYDGTSVSNYSTINMSAEARQALQAGDNVLCVMVSDTGGGNMYMDYGLYLSDLKDVVTRNDVPFTIANDETFPWTSEGSTAVVRGDNSKTYRSSWLTTSYYSEDRTEVSFSWASYNWGDHSLQLYIDGTQTSSTTNSSYTSQRYYLSPGEHVIAFRDSIGRYSTSSNWSGIQNLKIKSIKPLETAVLTANSQPLTFTNESALPWTIEDGYIEHGNWCKQNVGATFSTKFTIDETSKLSFTYKVFNTNYANSYNYENSHNLFVTINGVQITKSWNNVNDTYWCLALEPGEYTVEWKDTVYTDYADWIYYYSQIKDIELSSNWQTVELATAGTLGYEVLSLPAYDVLTDVEMLKVVGPLNASDWTDIKNMTNLKALDLSEAVISEIPNSAFDGKGWINSVILPEGITSIGEYAFRGTSLRKINIPSTVTTIKRNAFIGTPIQYLTFTEGSRLTTIERYAFQSCSSLQEVILPEGLTTIGYAAFEQCLAIQKVEMPNTVTSLGAYAFNSCTNMESIHFSDGLTSINDWVCNDCYALKDVHLPIGLTRIRREAFRDNGSLKEIDFPSTLTTIDYLAFYSSGLETVKLPVNLQWLGTEVFSYCRSLKYVEMPSYIERGSYTITSYYYNDGANYYTTSNNSGYRSNFTYCTALETIVMRSATPPANDADPFANARAKGDITLVVPSFSVVNYKLDTYWYQFGSIIEGDDVDYWKLTSPLMLTNNRRMQGSPDVDLYYGGQLTVGGSAPFTMNNFNLFVSEGNPGRLLNTCDNVSASAVTTRFSVNANTWYFFTPLHDVKVADITVSNDASYVFRYYDAQNRAANGASGSWKNVDTDKLLAGQGYIFHCNTACVITFPADVDGQAQLFRTTDVTRTLTVNEATSTANRSWNYIGNPYPTYYDIYYMDFTAPITVWTGSTYKAYSVADDDFVLRPMQSFFVQKPDAVDQIIFHKEGRQLTTDINHGAAVKGQNAPSQTNRRSIFNIQIAAENGMTDETRVVLNPVASMDYELSCDAAKFMSFDASVPQLFTIDEDGNNYAINERPVGDGTVTLAYFAGSEGTYTISALRSAGTIKLIDNELGTSTDLTTENYTFHSEATSGVNSARFMLMFGNGSQDAVDALDAPASLNGNIYDLSGRKVTTRNNHGVYIQNGRKVIK